MPTAAMAGDLGVALCPKPCGTGPCPSSADSRGRLLFDPKALVEAGGWKQGTALGHRLAASKAQTDLGGSFAENSC